MTLWNRLMEPKVPDAAFMVWEDEGFTDYTWADVVRAGERSAAGLRRLGVEPGTRVACVLTNTFDVCAGVLGIWLAGGVVLSMPTPARGMAPDEYLEQVFSLTRAGGAELLMLDAAFAGFVQPPPGLRVGSFGDLTDSGRLEPSFPDIDAPAFVQYSSGSTSSPKGCVLSARAIAAQLDMLEQHVSPDPERDRGCHWLPLSHDFGLFCGLIAGWTWGMPARLSTPMRFLSSPRTWLDDCADHEATMAIGPNFGLGLVLRAARRYQPSKPLRIRSWILGSDPIDAQVIRDAIEILGPMGVPAEAFTPGYGMAEATLAVTTGAVDQPPRIHEVALDGLYRGEVRAPSGEAGQLVAPIVSCGPPLPGASARIDGPGDIGEIVVKSPSLALGYLNDPRRTARTFVDGELRTGDLGFIQDGEVYVIGRQDDVISVNGRNIHATELESRLGRDERIRSGSCILVDVNENGRRRLMVLSEPAEDDVDFVDTARSMRKLVASTAGIGIDECVFLPRGSLPKSPSGKVQRFRCRELAVGGDGPELSRVRVA